MRFDESDPWFTWQQQLQREGLRELPAETLSPSSTPDPTLFDGWPAASTPRFPVEPDAAAD